MRALIAAAAASAALLGLGACGGDSGQGAPDATAAGTGTSATATETVTVQAPPRPEPLSAREAVGQRILASFTGPEPPRSLLRAIARGEVSGVVLFGDNAATVAGTRALARRLQAAARRWRRDTPLLIMTDQEGGQIRRLTDAPPARSAGQLGAAGQGATRRAGVATGRALTRAGVNVNLAPVADLGLPGGTIAAYERAFSADPAAVGRLAGAFANGLRTSGVLSTGKHFPGLGRAAVNTDDGTVRIDVPRGTLERRDLAPFRAIAGQVDLMMLASAIYPAIDPARPAVLSPAATALVRDIGFRGLTVTDDLEATGLAPFGDPSRLARRAATADVDLLMFARRRPGVSADAARSLRRWVSRDPQRLADARATAERILAVRRALAGPAQG